MIDLDARFAILDLCSRYNYYVDTGASAEWAGTFTPDGVFDGPVGHAEGRDALMAFCHSLAEQFPGAMHFTDNHLFEQDGDLVRHKCFLSFQVPVEGRTDLMLLGYEDEIVRSDGEWKFRLRRVGPLNGD